MSRLTICCLTLFLAIASVPAVASGPIRNHVAWTDTAGNPISCHDGGITRVGDTFYWYGTSYKDNTTGLWGRRGAQLQQGFNCYSSKNLVDWKYEGACLQFPKNGWLAQGTSHRPNVLACDKTGKSVLWFFCIGTTEPEYPAAMLAVAGSRRVQITSLFAGRRAAVTPRATISASQKMGAPPARAARAAVTKPGLNSKCRAASTEPAAWIMRMASSASSAEKAERSASARMMAKDWR